jgi:hypothetical protein
MVYKLALSAGLGGLAGYGWHRLVGCRSGGCPITANPFVSTLFGAAIGLLMVLS